jgi:uncharacterized protein
VASAVQILRKAWAGGIRFFDTARGYTDSEYKLGLAFAGMRDQIIIATKSHAHSPAELQADLRTSLETLQTSYIDIYQFHNPRVCYKPGDGSGMYECMLEAREQGLIRHIGISNHRLNIAREIIASGLYKTLQFPFSYLSSAEDIALVNECRQAGMGFIAMKALSGGLITDSAAAYAFMTQFGHVLPIWGIQRESELDEFLAYEEYPPQLTEERQAFIAREREELAGDFCRGCGYCQPCPAGIAIDTCARMGLLLKRAPAARFLEPEGQAMMAKIEGCLECGRCQAQCPYGLNPPQLLKKNLAEYRRILAAQD